jgi:anti-sigma B factor antagonist
MRWKRTIRHRLSPRSAEGAAMSLTLKSREVSVVTVLDLTGKITLGEGGQALRDELRLYLAKGVRRMVLNLAEVSYVDSSGLGELVSAFTGMKNLGVSWS